MGTNERTRWITRGSFAPGRREEKYGIAFPACPLLSPSYDLPGRRWRRFRPSSLSLVRARYERLRTTISLRERNAGLTPRLERERTQRRADLADGHLCTCGQGPGNSGAICRPAPESIRTRGDTPSCAPFPPSSKKKFALSLSLVEYSFDISLLLTCNRYFFFSFFP